MTIYLNKYIANVWKFSHWHIISNVLLLTLSAIFVQTLTFIANLFTAQHLGVTQYGQYTATLTLLNQSAILLTFGMDTWLLREGIKSTQEFIEKTSDAILFKVIIAIPWLIIMTETAHYLNPEVYVRSVFFVAALGFVFQTIGTLIQAAFKSQLHNKVTFFLQAINGLTLFIFTWLLVQRHSDLIEFMYVRTIAVTLSMIVGLYLFSQRYRFQANAGRLPHIIQQNIFFFLTDALSYIYATADVTIISIWLGKTQVGIYGPVITLISATMIVPSAVYAVALPLLSRSYLTNKATARLITIATIMALTTIGAIITASTFIFAPIIITLLYGDAFKGSIQILSFLSIIIWLRSINLSFGLILTAMYHQAQRVGVQIIIASLNVGLNLWIVQKYGIMGVASVYIFTETLLVVGYGSLVLKNTNWLTFDT